MDENRDAAFKTAVNPFSAASTWYKIGLAGQGLIKITGQNLTAAGAPSNISSDSLHLFYGGGMMLPVPNNVPRPTLKEIPLMVFDGGDGILNANDYIIFYGEAADRWIYPIDSNPRYLENPYTNMNYYWLAVSGNFGQPGMRISSIDGSIIGSADTTITSSLYYVRAGQNRLLMHDNSTGISDYYTWYWTDQPSFDFFLGLPHALPSSSVQVHIRAKASGLSLYVNNFVAQQSSAGNSEYYFTTDKANSGLNKLSLIMTPNFDSPPHLDFCEIAYPGSLTPLGDELDFTAKDAVSARAELVIDNQFSAAPMILDLSDPDNPVQIGGASVTTNNIRFQYSLSAGRNTRFYVCPTTKTTAASSITKTVRPALLDNASQVDLFVIAPKEFVSSLAEYSAYRSQKSGITVTVVSFEDILNQFSFGQYDPTAIRDFLKEAYEVLPAPCPSAVLLVGDGSYDFENNLNTATLNYIPPYIHSYDSTASDDNYVYFGNFGLLDSDTSHFSDRGYDMMISRWPVRSVGELNTVIEKIEKYEASTNFGPWRATVTFVADDEFGNFNTESFHTRQTEDLQKYHLPAAFRRNKIYLWDYPFDSNRQKPAVNQAIIRSINEGTLMVNYVGHGNPDTWAHEHVFNRNTDLPQLHNADRLALIFTASCSIGFFDDPTRDGMAEDLLRLRDGGAVGTVAATRLVFAGENADFNQQVFDILFGNDSLSICQAIFTAKLLRQYSSGSPRPIRNDRSYEFFGDPFMKLGVPRNTMRFDTRPDSILALTKNDVAGAIVTKNGGNPVGMEGSLDVFVYDSDIQKSHRVVNSSGQTVDIVNYALNGPVIYRGTTPVAGGDFRFSFVSPLDIGYGGSGAKISGYAQSSQSDAFGLIDSLPVSPIIASTSDSNGPTVKYTFGERKNFISGDKISPNENLTLYLSDPSGINLTGGSGHEISLIIDDQVENIINLTALFEYSPGSYTVGASAIFI